MTKNLSVQCSTDRSAQTAQTLISNWQHIKQQIASMCAKPSNSDTQTAGSITLVAVSKTKPAEAVLTLARQGQHDFGENYLQEALPKIEALAEQKNIIWHYIGAIQRNKTRDIAQNFAWVHTIERSIIADRLNKQRPPELGTLNVLIQVNIDDEESKSGCKVGEVQALVTHIKTLDNLTLRGLMILPAKDNTHAFSRTKALFDDVASRHPELPHWDTLSMGMSGDMAEAIRHGSTMVRVGSAIFGARTS